MPRHRSGPTGSTAPAFPRLFDLPVYYRRREELQANAGWRWYCFNETVGFIWLEARPAAIRAEYCFIRQRPSRVLVRREFEPRGKLFQLSCRGMTNAQIFDGLMCVFRDFRESGLLARYWIDLDAFKCVGPTIDWQFHLRADIPSSIPGLTSGRGGGH